MNKKNSKILILIAFTIILNGCTVFEMIKWSGLIKNYSEIAPPLSPTVRASATATVAATVAAMSSVAPTTWASPAWPAMPSASPTIAWASPAWSAMPSASPTIAWASPAWSAMPSVLPSTVWASPGATVRIYVLDDYQNYIDGATITAKLLATGAGTFADGSDTAIVTVINGNAVFNGVPSGVQIEYTATKTGYTTRKLVYVAVSGSGAYTGVNDISFGFTGGGTVYGGANYALSDKPEVVAIDPAYNSSGVAPSTSFKLTFSEDVDKSSVEDNFLISTNTDQTTPFTVGYTFGSKGANVYDKSCYDWMLWEGEKDVTFSPKSGSNLPTDKDSMKVPQYRVTFKNQFKDKGGVSSRAINPNDGPFRVTTTWKDIVPFSIISDTTAPKVDAAYISDATTIKIRFTEPMALFPLTAGNFYNSNLLNKNTYELSISNDGMTYNSIPETITITSFDGADASNRTIKLTINSSLASYAGKRLKVKVILPLSDPAGNEITSDSDKYVTFVVPTL